MAWGTTTTPTTSRTTRVRRAPPARAPFRPRASTTCARADEFEEDAADEEPRQALPAVSQRSKPKPEKKSYTENKGQTEHRPQLSPGFSGKFGKLGLIGPISSTPEQPEEKPEPRRENRKVVPAAELAVPRRHFIAPPSAETRQLRDLKAARLKALKPVLQLRDVDFTIYETPPLTGYELYVRHQSWCSSCCLGDRELNSGFVPMRHILLAGTCVQRQCKLVMMMPVSKFKLTRSKWETSSANALRI